MTDPSTPFDIWRPPGDYQEVSSALVGITVFAPKQKETSEIEQPVVFECPNCGAVTRFDVAAGGVACEHCGFISPLRSEQVGKQAQSFEFTLDTLRQAEKGWGVERRELRCQRCGAALAIPREALTITCPFCGSNEVNLHDAVVDNLRPRFLVPFSIQPEAIHARAASWLGQGWYHPSELATNTIIDRFIGIYLPFWTFSSHISSTWKAEVGYERQIPYYDSSSKAWKTRTVIDWRWENGQVSNEVDDLIVSGSSHIDQQILSQIQPFDLKNLVAYRPDYLAGWQAHTFDILLPDAWESGKATMREEAKATCYKDITTNHVRNFSMTADFQDETWRYILLPVYLAAYQFEGKTYQVMINGQNGVVAGQKPVVWWKVWVVIAALFSPGFLCGLASLPLLLVGGMGVFTLIITLILLVIAGLLSFKIYHQALSSEVG